MQNIETDFLGEISDYYTATIKEFGATPRGVDWNGEKGQFLRFGQLCKIIDQSKEFIINDFGCGYGALHDYLESKYHIFSYNGFDISENMILAAKCRNLNKKNAAFFHSDSPHVLADFSVASGIFNVRLKKTDNEWFNYLIQILDVLNATSKRAFSFNCLTSYSDLDKRKDYLYYADPCVLFDLCKKRYSSNVALYHDYGLYEFTISVDKR